MTLSAFSFLLTLHLGGGPLSFSLIRDPPYPTQVWPHASLLLAPVLAAGTCNVLTSRLSCASVTVGVTSPFVLGSGHFVSMLSS